MRAAILGEFGATPEVGDVDEPVAADGQVLVAVRAAGLNPVDLSKASGSFYSAVPAVPYVVGGEGVGELPDGERVYFDGPVAPHGAMAQRTAIDRASAIPLPDGVDDGLAVACGIAGLAAWLALDWRAGLRPGERVLVLGASGVVGAIAVQGARLLGAGHVVAAARSREGLARARDLGAQATVSLDAPGDELAAALREAAGGDGFDVVIDPVWGAPAAAALEACAPRARLVQIGQSAGATAEVSSATVRGKALAVLGHTNFRAPREVKRAAYGRMVEAAANGDLRVDVERVPLEEIADAWERQRSSPNRKLVIVP